jgi:hypothetical protein
VTVTYGPLARSHTCTLLISESVTVLYHSSPARNEDPRRAQAGQWRRHTTEAQAGSYYVTAGDGPSHDSRCSQPEAAINVGVIGPRAYSLRVSTRPRPLAAVTVTAGPPPAAATRTRSRISLSDQQPRRRPASRVAFTCCERDINAPGQPPIPAAGGTSICGQPAAGPAAFTSDSDRHGDFNPMTVRVPANKQ